MKMSLTELDDDTVRSMAIRAIFPDFGGKFNSIDFHRKDDILVTANDDDSVRLYDIANAKLLKTTYHKKHGADRICFTHHPSYVICSSKYNLDSTGESLKYLSMYDNRCPRYFKGHKDIIVSLCMSPINDSFMSGSLDHSVRIWDLRVNASWSSLLFFCSFSSKKHIIFVSTGRVRVRYFQPVRVMGCVRVGGKKTLTHGDPTQTRPMMGIWPISGQAETNKKKKFCKDGHCKKNIKYTFHIFIKSNFKWENSHHKSLNSSNITNLWISTVDLRQNQSKSGSGPLIFVKTNSKVNLDR
ncbi:hypothetical protein UlMin_022784 [Ulmus minor]